MIRISITTLFLPITALASSQIKSDSVIKQQSKEINGQEINGILDGVYFIPEEPSHDTIYLNDFDTPVYNRDFALENRDPYQYQISRNNVIKKYGNKRPEKIKEAVFINPIEIIDDPERSNLFFSESNANRKTKPILPNSIYTFVDTSQLNRPKNSTKIILDSTFNFPYEAYLTHYYLKKTEVSNKEYRTFINWIKDSIIREKIVLNIASDEESIKYIQYDPSVSCNTEKKNFATPSDRKTNRALFPLNWDKKIDYDDPEIQAIIDEHLYLEQDKRFYRRKTIDVNVLNYNYFEGEVSKVIPAYPDTLVWSKFRFENSYSTLVNAYFWHPYYDNYPVVGLNYEQIKAFLHWKAKMIEKEINGRQEKYTVVCRLPNPVQWDMVRSIEMPKKEMMIYTDAYPYLSQQNWITDLKLAPRIIVDSIDSATKEDTTSSLRLYDEQDPFRKTRWDIKDPGKNKSPQFLYEVTEDEDYPWCYSSQTEFNFLNGNVSEWINGDYHQWKSIMDYRHQLLDSIPTPSSKHIVENEKFYDQEYNWSGGKMVAGSNWYHQFFQNTKTDYPMRFVNPYQSYATVGFRYVIYVIPKE